MPSRRRGERVGVPAEPWRLRPGPVEPSTRHAWAELLPAAVLTAV